MFSCNIDNIDRIIEQLKARIAKAEELRAEIEKLNMFEVGIRKSDNGIVHLNYLLNTEPELRIEVSILPPTGQSPFTITLEQFKENYIPYSQKARTILPKRD
jgi:hypothetical protein